MKGPNQCCIVIDYLQTSTVSYNYYRCSTVLVVAFSIFFAGWLGISRFNSRAGDDRIILQYQ